MNYGDIIVYFMSVLCLGAAGGYAIAGDYRRVIYFILASAINYMVTIL